MEQPKNIVPIEKLEIGMKLRLLEGPRKNEIVQIKAIDLTVEKIHFNSGFTFFERQGIRWVVADAKLITKILQEPVEKLLKLEQDYELASLHDAMQQQDQTEIKRSKQRLAEIHKELEMVK